MALRYAVPGFTFILIFLLVNVVVLPSLLNKITSETKVTSEILGIFLGFLTLLSGQAIGFLVSQLWYSIFELFRSRVVKEPFDILACNHVLRDKRKVVYDYLMNSEKRKELRDYLDRRWDLANLLGSTTIAVLLGALFGYFLRYDYLIKGDSMNWIYEVWIIPAVLVILFLTLFYNTRRVFRENKEMGVLLTRLLINKLKEKNKILRDILPKEYFSSEKERRKGWSFPHARRIVGNKVERSDEIPPESGVETPTNPLGRGS